MFLQYNSQNNTLTGQLLECDRSTVSGKTYPYQVVVPAVNEFQQFIRENKATGSFYLHLSNIVQPIDVTKVAVQATETYFQNKILYGTLKILDTDSGRLLTSMLNVKYRFRAAMTATAVVKHQTVSELHIVSFSVTR